MLTIWLIVILFGTGITIIGGLKFNEEWTKNDAKKQLHIIPEFILMDFEIEAKFDEDLRDKILTQCKPKISVPNGNVEDLKVIPLSPFFAENLYKENKSAKRNFKIEKDIYENIKSFTINGLVSSNDNLTSLKFKSNSNKIICSTLDDEYKNSYIEVREYNKQTNCFKLLYNNIQLNNQFFKQSKFITDLDNGDIIFSLSLRHNINIEKIENIILKTKSTKYFMLTNLHKNHIGQYNAKLKLILNE